MKHEDHDQADDQPESNILIYVIQQDLRSAYLSNELKLIYHEFQAQAIQRKSTPLKMCYETSIVKRGENPPVPARKTVFMGHANRIIANTS